MRAERMRTAEMERKDETEWYLHQVSCVSTDGSCGKHRPHAISIANDDNDQSEVRDGHDSIEHDANVRVVGREAGQAS